MPMDPNVLPGQDCRGNELSSQHRDQRISLGVEEIVNEEEARRRREQLNRRPSYRMILKDLETVGDKQLKKEMDEPSLSAEMLNNDGGQVQKQISSQSPDESSTTSNFLSSDNGVAHLIRNFPPPNNTGLNNAPPPPPLAPTAPLCVGVSSAASISSTPNPIGAQALHLSSPTQAHLSLGQLNLIAPQQHSNISQRIQSTVAPTVEIPSQPQPQMRAGQQPLLNAVNNLEMLGLKTGAVPESISTAFSQNDWQNNLLTTYNRQQHQSVAPNHLLQQQQTPPSNSSTSAITLTDINSSNNNASGGGTSQHVGPPQNHGGLGTRQGSASLTSFITHRSDNEETNRKRQVRLLKNREAAKECRRKKKEYVKCLENRVAVLENQNKALIEELKTLKELYCRKEKGGEMQ
uniref:BZIP domain-containing protein n=1 Tax=Meloidogyne incognita TaxID=6306 RepID=A0A914KUB5_MELIC